MSDLLKLQMEFARAVSLLIAKVPSFGFDGVTLGEGFRTKEQAQWDCQHHTGVLDSLHCERLAQDFNFFKGGQYVKDGDQLAAIGAWWKSLGPNYRWGGDIVHPRPDGNHFSLSPDGERA